MSAGSSASTKDGLIESVIEFSVKNRAVVLMLTLAVSLWGVYCLQRTPVDVTTQTVSVEILRVVHGTDVEDRNGETQPATGKTPIAEVELRGRATA